MVTRSYGSADSMEKKLTKNPVVAFVPKPMLSGQSVQQQTRVGDVNAAGIPFVSKVQMDKNEQAQSDKDAQIELDKISANFANTLKGLGSGSGAKPMSDSDILARDKFNYDQNVATGKYQGLLDYFNNGSYKTGFDSLRGLLKENNRTGTQTINDTYDNRMGQIAEILRTGNTGV